MPAILRTNPDSLRVLPQQGDNHLILRVKSTVTGIVYQISHVRIPKQNRPICNGIRVSVSGEIPLCVSNNAFNVITIPVWLIFMFAVAQVRGAHRRKHFIIIKGAGIIAKVVGYPAVQQRFHSAEIAHAVDFFVILVQFVQLLRISQLSVVNTLYLCPIGIIIRVRKGGGDKLEHD